MNIPKKKQGDLVTFKEDKKMMTRICPKCEQVFFAENNYDYSLCQECHNEQIQTITNYFAKLNVGGKNYDN